MVTFLLNNYSITTCTSVGGVFYIEKWYAILSEPIIIKLAATWLLIDVDCSLMTLLIDSGGARSRSGKLHSKSAANFPGIDIYKNRAHILSFCGVNVHARWLNFIATGWACCCAKCKDLIFVNIKWLIYEHWLALFKRILLLIHLLVKIMPFKYDVLQIKT